MRNNKNNITSGLENIISFFRNITLHFTGKKEIITLSLTIIMLSFASITLCLSSVSNTSALSYSSNVNIGFIFNPTISLSISPDNLTISNLTPGTAAESNTITVNVATNTAYGYQLTANVGDNTTNYNTTSLVHASSATSTPTSNTTFTSLAYGSSVANKDNLSPNTWGYSYSNDSGTTWRPYSGLPLYSDTNHSANLISTYTAADSRSIEFKIAAKASETQPSGDYTNIINFYATSVPEPPLLYDVVEDMTKGTLAENNVKLSDPITQANSGVYTYDPTVYGTASDASNDYDIYFYRGILDTDAGLGTYGSDGKADAWPNYVKLSNNTCWRIVRTTGSGGTKMIYNGTYKNGTCANSGGDVSVGTSPFNDTSVKKNGKTYYGIQYQNAQSVGYTYSNKVEPGVTTPVAIRDLFGANDNDTATNTEDSIVKQLIEDWYAINMIGYTSRLESSSGYCNDRSLYNNDSYAINEVLSDDVEIVPYDTTSNILYRFGSYVRTVTNAQEITLRCPRGDVDIYSINTAENGNKQLVYPIALLSADEAVFSGSGPDASSYYAYSDKMFLASGGWYWLLSPSTPKNVISMYWQNGYFRWNNSVNYQYTPYRPVISLMHHIQVTSGSGTATSPWTIE